MKAEKEAFFDFEDDIEDAFSFLPLCILNDVRNIDEEHKHQASGPPPRLPYQVYNYIYTQ